MREFGFEVRSPCGRVWFVPKSAVVADYVEFLIQEDKLSPDEAYAQVEAEGGADFWFYEQFDWSDVQRHGRLIKEASPKQITAALDFLRDYVGGGPGNDCTETEGQATEGAK